MIAHLHVHSHYSFFDSTLAPEDLPRLALERGYTAIALTDTNSLAGAVGFFKACRETQVQPVLGTEVDDPRTGERAIVLIRDWTGWGAVCRLLTARHLQGEPEPEVVQDLSGAWVKGGRTIDPGENGKRRFPSPAGPFMATEAPDRRTPSGRDEEPHASTEFFPRYQEFETGAFDLRAALAELPAKHVIVLTDSPDLLGCLASRFPGPSRSGAGISPVYAELILVPSRRSLSRRTYETARRLGIPLVATRDVHYANPEDVPLYRVLQAVGRGSTVGRLEWDTANQAAEPPGFYSTAAPPRESHPEHALVDRCDLLAGWKGLRIELERSVREIVQACRFDLPLDRWQLPHPHLDTGETPFSQLWKIAFAGLESRYRPLTPEVIERLRREIEVIDRLGFSNYFLVANEIVEEARRRGLHVLGRGSAANSLVSYALQFTGVDPLRHHLYFERFLNPERGSPPDIDLDFSWKDRDAIVDWVFDRFGRDRVALISTTVRLQGRQAIREVAKALGLADAQISRVTRHIPFWYSRSMDLKTLDEQFAECRGLPLRETPWSTILPQAQRLLGFPRHYGIHCGGVVITPEPIWRYVPLVRSAKGFVVTQMDMFPIEDLGLIKIDLLGNRSLGVFKDTLHEIGAL